MNDNIENPYIRQLEELMMTKTRTTYEILDRVITVTIARYALSEITYNEDGNMFIIKVDPDGYTIQITPNTNKTTVIITIDLNSADNVIAVMELGRMGPIVENYGVMDSNLRKTIKQYFSDLESINFTPDVTVEESDDGDTQIIEESD